MQRNARSMRRAEKNVPSQEISAGVISGSTTQDMRRMRSRRAAHHFSMISNRKKYVCGRGRPSFGRRRVIYNWRRCVLAAKARRDATRGQKDVCSLASWGPGAVLGTYDRLRSGWWAVWWACYWVLGAGRGVLALVWGCACVRAFLVSAGAESSEKGGVIQAADGSRLQPQIHLCC